MHINLPYSLPIIDAIRNDYERFRLSTHEFSHQGLFTDGMGVYAVITEASNPEVESQLTERYQKNHIAGIPAATIVSKTVPDFRQIPSRNSFEKSQLLGEPENVGEFINKLTMHIPNKFHPFNADLSWSTNEFRLIFKREISSSEQEEIQLICEALGYQGYQYFFEVNNELKEYPGEVPFRPNTHNNLLLVASGFIQKQFPKQILDEYEEDEDFWIQNQHKVFSTNTTNNSSDYLPANFLTKKTRCFVDASVFARQNIRVYLTMYEQVIVALPLKNESDYFYQMFKFNTFELRELILRGRLLFVAPQNIARYATELLHEIISVDPNAIIFSRRLAAATIKGIQQKSGIVGSTFSSDEQYEFLHHCSTSKSKALQQLSRALSEQWLFTEFMVDKEGATSAFRAGLSSLAANVYQDKNLDFTIEFTSAGSSYEFAQGLSAHHFPFDSASYSELAACSVISSLYNGVTETPQQIRESKLNLLLSEVLAIDNDMSVLELDDALENSQIRAIPSIIGQFADLDESSRAKKLYEIREELKQIEKNNSRLSSLDFSGFFLPAIAGAAMESSQVPGGAYVTLGAWLIKALTVYGAKSSLGDNPIFTRLSSINHSVSHDAVIVKSIRESVNRKV